MGALSILNFFDSSNLFACAVANNFFYYLTTNSIYSHLTTKAETSHAKRFELSRKFKIQLALLYNLLVQHRRFGTLNWCINVF